MSAETARNHDPGQALLDLYDRALPAVYGYLLSRCGEQPLAEDLTSEVFLAAVDAVKRQSLAALSTSWLIGTARHKLVDHWRAREREQRGFRVVANDQNVDDPWDAELDSVVAQTILSQLPAQHRAALTLRYVDDLPVAEVATLLDRTVHATEALLVRAKAAFRRAYTAPEEHHA